ncbi:MAG: TlyA family RNA methyltransferase [Vicinamibacteria bacterium]|nr:TlyA family RNA methyltransferase [Vicinamibacteria bacterium]
MGEARRSPKTRLDVWLVERGLAESRQKAQALVMAGRVRVSGQPAPKPGLAIAEDARVEVLSGPEHVGRGALKLIGALDAFALDPRDRVVIDVGASTGGFTEVLLARGARRIYAVDVGRAQLHERVRHDPRVIVREGLNARQLSPAEIPEVCNLAVMDVSFISVLKILPALALVLTPDADAIVLVKPQFELARRDIGRGGLVKDSALHRQALLGVAAAAQQAHGYVVRAACPSPITGSAGNREFFLHLARSGASLPAETMQAMITGAVLA